MKKLILLILLFPCFVFAEPTPIPTPTARQCFVCKQWKANKYMTLEGIKAEAAPVPIEMREHIFICYDCLAMSSQGLCSVELKIQGITLPLIGSWKIYKDFVNPQ